MFNWCELGSTFFDTFVLSRFKINILMFSWYSATSARWSSAGWLLDLLQVDLLASGASLVWPRSADRERRSRPAPTKDFFESLADCIRWVQSLLKELCYTSSWISSPCSGIAWPSWWTTSPPSSTESPKFTATGGGLGEADLSLWKPW